MTFADLALPDHVRDALGARLRPLPDPAADVDRALTRYHQAFADLPTPLLQQIIDFGRHNDAPGLMLVRNLPRDAELPPTPADGGPATGRTSFVAEGVLLGLTGLLGEPIGVLTEKDGRIVHDVVPMPEGAHAQTNQGSAVFLNFHSDITYDAIGRYDLANPDFLVLNCLRGAPDDDAVTYYADARAICAALPDSVVDTLRSPLFRLNAPGSYTRDIAEGDEVLSEPVPILSGAARFPEIAVSANGTRPLTRGATAALEALRQACRVAADEVRLSPGQALLINNRKGVHARSVFQTRYDGRDRWLQRTYIRRNLWSVRYRATPEDRRVHY
ncbi:TauD/TfdA family dioxygenase [Streptomyces pseudovenezuelae]|uniref:L-asparagine oxygenase n=1 Tax=Streptomyces pseudovenezuelae TaxID=67350 RepID=A0ABT6LLQ0_9ACTN|nr:TauD/TfdA family dioxygenase [Streptomyces pseudovenezuelae]MDH6216880.1 L-asparagine oxygenase [Streptomyces pseudovenezuelae]